MVVRSWTRNSSNSEVKCQNWQSERSIKWILTSDSECTMWNHPRKLKIWEISDGWRKYSNFIQSLRIGETRINQKYGKLRNSIMWLPGGCGTWNFQNILTTCSSKYIQISDHSEVVMFWLGEIVWNAPYMIGMWIHFCVAIETHFPILET